MIRGPFLVLLLWISVLPLFAQLSDADEDTQRKCAQYLQTPLPAEAANVPAPKSWPRCDSYRSYAGLGRQVDFAAARQCAWAERLAQKAEIEPHYTVASLFGGSAMLSVLYANGQGVPRNLPLALRFACEWGWAPAEFSARIDHLERLQENPSSDSLFRYCDDISSGFMEGFCAAYSEQVAEQERTRYLEKFSAALDPRQRRAFAKLDAAQKEYAAAHAQGEIDLSGTARARLQIDARQSLRQDFLAALQAFDAGHLPTGSKTTLADAESKRGRALRDALQSATEREMEPGSVHPDGIRSADRAWLKYRDAWIAFAHLRYPQVPPEAWLTLLTNDRTAVIDGSFCDIDAADNQCTQGDKWKPSPMP